VLARMALLVWAQGQQALELAVEWPEQMVLVGVLLDEAALCLRYHVRRQGQAQLRALQA